MVKDPFKDELHLVKLRYTRVVFGVSCSPFLLNATLQHHLEKFRTSNPELVDTLSQSMYVDDMIVGADTREEAYELYANSKEVLAHGSFNLRKFIMNLQPLQND